MLRSAIAFIIASCMLPTVIHAEGRGQGQGQEQGRVVYRIPVSGSVEVDLSDLISSTLQTAAGEPGSIIVLDIGASGGANE